LSIYPLLKHDAKKRIEEIQNLECRKDNVVFVIYPKISVKRYLIVWALTLQEWGMFKEWVTRYENVTQFT
jgi:hypothetical protein